MSDINPDEIVEVEIVEADYCTVDFCEHWHAAIYLFWNGRAKPFAVAYLGRESVAQLAAELVTNIKPEGTA